uniref:Uncharacterized protein n=1 Tax=Acrobeloides nanus TaxID=290746 RepID=A0A914CIT7_9BILA
MEHLFEAVRNRAIDCENLQCSCFSVKENVKNLTELIDYNIHLFRKTLAYKALISESDPLDAAPIMDPFDQSFDEEKIRKGQHGVTTETIESFYKRVNADGFREINHAENHMFYGRDDVMDWIQFQFPHASFLLFVFIHDVFKISQGGVKRIVYKLGNGNYVATAIFCFLVENKIDERPEFKDMWEKVQPCPRHWVPKMHKRVTQNYCRDRKKNFVNLIPKHTRSEYLNRRYKQIVGAWKKDYPNLFEKKSFNLDQNALNNPNPGELFECTNCKLKFSMRYAVSCVQTYNVNTALQKSMHHYCRKCCCKISKEKKFNIVFCPERGTCIQCLGTISGQRCKNPIPTKEIYTYLEPDNRYNFNNTLLEKLVKSCEHVHLEEDEPEEPEPNVSPHISLESLNAVTPNDDDASDWE